MNDTLTTLTKSTSILGLTALIFWTSTTQMHESNQLHLEALQTSNAQHAAALNESIERLQDQAEACAEDRKDLWNEIIKLKD